MEVVSDCKDWEYRAEGNLHIIIANKKTKQVLRLLKCHKDQSNHRGISTLEASENELSFVRHVAHPLMKNCIACYPMHLFAFSDVFLKNIAKKIVNDRPSFRLNKIIDESCKYGILMPDFCHVLPPPPSNSGLNISVEIKPKQGFISSGDTRCKFSQYQHKKLQAMVCEGESAYCPIDLFSGSKKRMQKAIKAMICNPQNNLRVFKNGTSIFSQELLKEKNHDRPKDYFRSNVLPMLLPHIDEKFHKENLKHASEIFQDLLCNLLLHPVCEKIVEENHAPQFCDGSNPKKEILRLKVITDRTKKLCQDTGLPSNCTLGLLLSLQKLEDRSITEYNKMYKLLEEHLKVFPEEECELSLKGPYDSPQWQKIVKEIHEHHPPTIVGNQDPSTLEVGEIVSSLRKFLVATSFKDCSIIMTFQPKSDERTISNKDLPMTIKTRHGQEYWALLALVDSDPKSASRIPQYYNNACEPLN